ncbi:MULTISPECIES: PBSX family phage terminase large subunit [unclassified Lactobacillus]|uniref:PBSX family phage terminase large subunit n=1 Tax=unclassified Lactobacillus TaxID=2620435 RepID=UPI000BEEA15C|nr:MULTISPECIES: PBSX family phage terminase large subunit [unclassified Lactobacillus]PEG86881.1 PBSX family phage terminase large subunit [Lactobacillus sp. UMNPBX14]PEH02430.1 PBSX family phage terminase large subunit [Lactobacillus sp. UMNPBX6]
MLLKKVLNKHFTQKQQMVLNQFINNKDWSLMINYGAVRSGKTVANNYCFIMSLIRVRKLADKDKVKDPLYILAGTSKKNIYNNVLNPLFNDFDLIPEQDSIGNLHLFGVTIILAYTGTIAGLRGIRGSSAYGAYINEASLANEKVFEEIRDRCSEGEGRVICDTNPDIPTHWLKQDYIDNPSKQIISNHFVLDDNTFLSKRYVETKKATTPSGMFYDRSVLGLWVTGEGIVYQDFNKDTMVIPDNKIPEGLHYYCGVDWGYEHPNPILLLGDDDQGNTYVLRDYTKKHKFINYWVKIAQNLQDEFGSNLIFYADSARPDNVNEFQAAGINCINANKNVLPGIECVAQKMREGKFFVAESCSQGLMNEIYQYAWDENTGQPLKENDVRHNDRLDALRYAIYSKNAKGGYIPWN